jgi:hypothetical protein
MLKEWDNVASIVNACGLGLERTGPQIKNKWMDLKYRTKKKASVLKNDLLKTGGGPRKEKPLTDIEQRILALIGETCVSGIQGLDFDSTARIVSSLENIFTL